MMPGGARVTEAANAKRMKNAGKAAMASSVRYRVAKAVAALPEAPDPQRELIALARAGDGHAMWRADELFVNWRKSKRKAA